MKAALIDPPSLADFGFADPFCEATLLTFGLRPDRHPLASPITGISRTPSLLIVTYTCVAASWIILMLWNRS